MNVTGARPELAADSEFPPVEPPSVQLPTAATPAAFVTLVPPVMDPPPDAIANITETPGFGLPLASLTMTEGGIETAPPTIAD